MDNLKIPQWVNTIPSAADGPLCKSYLAALKANMTPTYIDRDTCTGYFSSQHDDYVVTLDSCICGNHYRPCKHQYRLAMELGLMAGDFIHDPSKIKYKREGICISDAVDRLEALPVEAQKVLHYALDNLNLVGGAVLPVDQAPLAQYAEQLSEAKLLIRLDEPAGYRLYPDLEKSKFKLQRYLRRKFDLDSILDPDKGIFLVPRHSIVKFCTDGTYQLSLPKDELTALLDAHHANPLDGFQISFE